MGKIYHIFFGKYHCDTSGEETSIGKTKPSKIKSSNGAIRPKREVLLNKAGQFLFKDNPSLLLTLTIFYPRKRHL